MDDNKYTFLTNIKKRLFWEQYRLVIWSEKLKADQMRLEVVYINNKFERNNNVSGLYYICGVNDTDIVQYLTHLKNKYKIYELIETNYKFENSQITSKFIITKTDKLLFQEEDTK